MEFAGSASMTVPLSILNKGSCEPFKAVVHGASLGLFAIMGLYNAAAWINRRERHLAVNALIYSLGVAWERRLVAHHVEACRAAETVATPLLSLVLSAESSCCPDRKVA
jgi:hypothetical protein